MTETTIPPNKIDTMNIYFSTNFPEMRAVNTFNWLSLEIANITKRLETGQRINSAKDDPSGLISRDGMRADMKGIQTAIQNTSRANSLFSAAETGMANISRILIGDITDPSDTGLIGMIYDDTMSASMKRGYIDDILNMINSIARSTTYNGKSILDGSLDYQTSGVDSRQISNLAVSRAQVPQPVSIKIIENGEKGMLKLNQAKIGDKDVALQIQGGTGQAASLTFTAGMSAEDIVNLVNQNTNRTGVTARIEEGLTNNQLLINSVGGDNDLVFTVKEGNAGNFSVAIGEDPLSTDPTKITLSQVGSTFVINYGGIPSSGIAPTASQLLDILNNGNVGVDVFESSPGDLAAFRNTFNVEIAEGQTGNGLISDAWRQISIGDAFSGNGLQFFGGNNANKIQINGGVSTSLNAQLDNVDSSLLVIQLETDAQGNVLTTADELVDYLNGLPAPNNGGITASVIRPEGQSYRDKEMVSAKFGYGIVLPTVDSFGTPATVDLVTFLDSSYKAINATDRGATKIIFETVTEGSKQTVQVKDISGQLLITDKDGKAATIDSGKDVVAKVNGYEAFGDGRTISFFSDTLSFTTDVNENVKEGDMVRFNIIGGGATFQLGKDVQSDMQLYVGIPSVDTLHLGGKSGFLDELRDIDFDTDAGKQKAYKIVSEAVNQVATQRAFIGALQKSTLDTNAVQLGSQLESVTAAEAEISNADTAEESSRLSRAELLAQTAMQSILYSRSFAQYIINSLF